MALFARAYGSARHRAAALNYSIPTLRDCIFFANGSDQEAIVRDLTRNVYAVSGGFGSGDWQSVSDTTQGVSGRVLKYDGAGGSSALAFSDYDRSHLASTALTAAIRCNITAIPANFQLYAKYLVNAMDTPSWQISADGTGAAVFCQIHGNGGATDNTGSPSIPFGRWATYTIRWIASNGMSMTVWSDDGVKLGETTGGSSADTIRYENNTISIMPFTAGLFDFACVFRRSLSDRELSHLIKRRSEILAPNTRRTRVNLISAVGLFPPFKQRDPTQLRM